MSIEQATTIITSILQGGTLIYVGRQIINGLRERIKGLENTINVQEGTLKVMREQISETQNISSMYRNLLSNLPSDIDRFKEIMKKTTDETISHLTTSNEQNKKRAEEAEKRVESMESSGTYCDKHLKILRALLTPEEHPHRTRPFDITTIARIILGSPELIVPHIHQSTSLTKMFSSIGAEVHNNVSDDELSSKLKTAQDRIAAGKTDLENFIFTRSVDGNFAIFGNKLYLSTARLNIMNDEFHYLKTLK